MVTILLATLNGEDYLKAQLESIVAQTYENWQLVVGDDGSTVVRSAFLKNSVNNIRNK